MGIIGCAVLIVLFCLFYCLVAWCLDCFPFGHKQRSKKDQFVRTGDRTPVSPSNLYKPSSVPAHERFETNTTFKDAHHDEPNNIALKGNANDIGDKKEDNMHRNVHNHDD